MGPKKHTDVGELAVLKDKEVVLLRESSQTLDDGMIEILQDVDMSLQGS